MSTKSAVVTARLKPEIKQQAEEILNELGIPVSVFIDMCYRQVILKKGIPFEVSLSYSSPTYGDLGEEQFVEMMKIGFGQFKKGESMPFGDAIKEIRKDVLNAE